MERGSLSDTSLSSFAKWLRTQPQRPELNGVFPMNAATLGITNSMDRGFSKMELIYPNLELLKQSAVFTINEGFTQEIDEETLHIVVCWSNVPDDIVGGPLLGYWRFLHHIRHVLGIKMFLAMDAQIDVDYYMIKMFVLHVLFFAEGKGDSHVITGFTPFQAGVFERVRRKLLDEEHVVECVASATPGELTIRFLSE